MKSKASPGAVLSERKQNMWMTRGLWSYVVAEFMVQKSVNLSLISRGYPEVVALIEGGRVDIGFVYDSALDSAAANGEHFEDWTLLANLHCPRLVLRGRLVDSLAAGRHQDGGRDVFPASSVGDPRGRALDPHR